MFRLFIAGLIASLGSFSLAASPIQYCPENSFFSHSGEKSFFSRYKEFGKITTGQNNEQLLIGNI